MKIKNIILATSLSLSSYAFASDAPIIEKAWLHNQLPENITAYARIPHPMFLFAEADSNLKPLYTDNNYITSITKVRNALIDMMDSNDKLAPDEKKIFKTLFTKVRAPLELVIPEYNDFSKPPVALLATKMDYPNTEALIADISKVLEKSSVNIKSTGENTGEIYGKGTPFKVIFEFDNKTRQLLVSLSMQGVAPSTIISKNQGNNSAIKRSEELIDDSGHGLFVSFKPNANLLKMLPMNPQSREIANQLGMESVKEIAFGMGVAQKRPKIKMLVDMPKIGVRNFIPSHSQITSIPYHGVVHSMVNVSLPDAQFIKNIFEQFGNAKALEKNKKFNKVAAFLDTFGRNFTVIIDDNGTYMVTDKEFDADLQAYIKEQGAEDLGLTITEQKVGNSVLKQLDIAPLWDSVAKDIVKNMPSKDEAAIISMVYKALFSNHFYWINEGDNVVISTLPQPLLARQQLKSSGTIDSLLKDNHINSEQPFFSGMTSIRNLSQRAYYEKLKLLNSLGDIAGVAMNVEKYPLSQSLNFAEYGEIAFAVDNGGDMLSAEISLDNGFTDLAVLTKEIYGPMNSVAVVGILSAIAIPAYQDYLERSKMTALYKHSARLQTDIAVFYAEENKLPNAEDAYIKSAIENTFIPNVQSIEVNEGVITLNFDEYGKVMTLTPETQETGQISRWTCTSKGIKNRSLPRSCR